MKAVRTLQAKIEESPGRCAKMDPPSRIRNNFEKETDPLTIATARIPIQHNPEAQCFGHSRSRPMFMCPCRLIPTFPCGCFMPTGAHEYIFRMKCLRLAQNILADPTVFGVNEGFLEDTKVCVESTLTLRAGIPKREVECGCSQVVGHLVYYGRKMTPSNGEFVLLSDCLKTAFMLVDGFLRIYPPLEIPEAKLVLRDMISVTAARSARLSARQSTGMRIRGKG